MLTLQKAVIRKLNHSKWAGIGLINQIDNMILESIDSGLSKISLNINDIANCLKVIPSNHSELIEAAQEIYLHYFIMGFDLEMHEIENSPNLTIFGWNESIKDIIL